MQQSISDLGTTLQDQIDNNTDLIGALQAGIDVLNDLLALKALVDNEQCPDGDAMVEVQSDGSVVCEDLGGGGATGIQQRRVIRGSWLNPNQIVGVNAYCPAGWTVTGGGYFHYSQAPVEMMTAGNGYYVRARNTNSYGIYSYSSAQCIRLIN